MVKKILIVGAGHGGLIAGSHLARKEGYEVYLYEKKSENNLGFPWDDDFNLSTFEEVGLETPSSDRYSRKGRSVFISPDLKTRIETNIPEEEREIAFDRKELYIMLIKFARDSGVHLNFKVNIKEPIIEKDLIIGIKDSDGNEIYGDLIIDSAGIDTPIRRNLPLSYEIPSSFKRGEYIHTYRAYFEWDKKYDASRKDFVIYIAFEGVCVIAWFRIIKDMVDVIICKLDPFRTNEIDNLMIKLRELNPALGMKLLFGGLVTKIPLRRTLEKIVGENYAVIGDAAGMTIPIMGSGVENAMLAGKILAKTIQNMDGKKAKNEDKLIKYPVDGLWEYQYIYFTEIGANMTSIDFLKNYMLTSNPSDLNYLLRKQLITAKDLEGGLTGAEIEMPIIELISRIMRGFSRFDLLLQLKFKVDALEKVKKIAKNIPQNYNPEKIKSWKQKLLRFYRKSDAKFADSIL